jgi:hypothetical protein
MSSLVPVMPGEPEGRDPVPRVKGESAELVALGPGYFAEPAPDLIRGEIPG